ncbi:DUF418 domain-containing protein [Pseudoduganella danionis]|uniref:DUF418 domain-containing protein n=1 Tax=Pseudoduganella danionis TaxID=1890295 RepID=A0ABW9SU73_9BURK|nr:DUF418 domain-containing protein [Pseudoduganella danionis]MTW33884.1 DUF418 domain-containing protein [Pseudoduganella danionis]
MNCFESSVPAQGLTAAASQTRLASIDILRGLALFGVLMVNLITEFRVSIFQQFLPQPAEAQLLQRAVLGFVHEALELKAFALFSLLFGVGLAMQFERLAPTGRAYYWLTRRLLILLLLGLIHLLLIWNGDILTEYALAGLLVLPLLGARRSVLAWTALALLVIYLILPGLPLPLGWPDEQWLAQHIGRANAVYAASNWWQVVQFGWSELPALLPLHVYIFPRTLALFVLGMLAWRSGLFADAAARRGRLLLGGCLLGAAGVILTAAGEAGLLASLAPVCLALACAALLIVALESAPVRRCLLPFAALGRMAFTHYILQSLIFGAIFFGYGLGQFGKLAPVPVFVLGVGVYAVQLLLSQIWLRHYRFGPIEWCWRTLMYGRRQPMKREM